MVRRSSVVVVGALVCALYQSTPVAGAEISGIVKGEDGTPLIGANLLLRRTSLPRLSSRQRTDWATASGPGGTFQLQVAAPGEYALCAQVPSSTWLNPCEWGSKQQVVPISGSQTASITVMLKRGIALPIRVDDPAQLLSQHEGKTPGAQLTLGVRSDALVFHTAVVTSQDSGGRRYEVVVPFDASVNLVVSSSLFRLADATGMDLPTGGITLPVRVASGQVPAAIRLVVAGITR